MYEFLIPINEYRFVYPWKWENQKKTYHALSTHEDTIPINVDI